MINILRAKFNQLHIITQLMIGVALFNLIDTYTTKVIVDFHGPIAELNPWLYAMIVYFDSWWPILVSKTVLIGVAWGALVWFNLDKLTLKVFIPLITALVLFTSCVSVWNIAQLTQL